MSPFNTIVNSIVYSNQANSKYNLKTYRCYEFKHLNNFKNRNRKFFEFFYFLMLLLASSYELLLAVNYNHFFIGFRFGLGLPDPNQT